MEQTGDNPRINLRGMIRLDQVEDLFNTLMEKVDNQQQEINQLKRLCRNFVTEQSFNAQCNVISQTIDGIERRIDIAQSAAMAQIGNERWYIHTCGIL